MNTDRRAIISALGSSAGARMLVLPISAVLGILVTRVIIDHYGQAAYGQYMLLVGIAAMLPFADLGITAAIMNAVSSARDPRRDEHLFGTMVTSFRILAGSATTVVLVAVLFTLGGVWPSVLGEGTLTERGSLAAGLCLMVFGLTLTVSFGQRLLIGLGKNYVSILIGGLQTPLVLAALFLAIRLGVDVGDYVAVFPYVAMMLLMVANLVLANRRIRPLLGKALREAFRWPLRPGARVLDTAWPLLVQMITLPIAMQSGRVVLSHLGTLDDLNEYSLAWQMFNPIWAVSVAAGIALWPIFARARSEQTDGPSAHKLSGVFAGVAGLGVLAICALSGTLADLASGGRITLGVPMLVLFSLLITAQAANSPLGMFMTDKGGLRAQALMCVALLVVTLTVSIGATMVWGAPGPVIGSFAGVLICQFLFNWVYVARARATTPARAGALT